MTILLIIYFNIQVKANILYSLLIIASIYLYLLCTRNLAYIMSCHLPIVPIYCCFIT